jgi:hypothetical protein
MGRSPIGTVDAWQRRFRDETRPSSDADYVMLLIPTRDTQAFRVDTASTTASALARDASSTMATWTGVLVGPFADGDDGIDEALSTLQAELDEKGRESQYRIDRESRGDPRFALTGTRTAMAAWTGLLVGVLAPIVILLSRWPTVGLAATLVFVFAGLGSGITCQIDTGDPFAQAALTFVLGITAFALAATIMIWLADWHPTWLLALAVPSVLSCLYRLHAGHVATT